MSSTHFSLLVHRTLLAERGILHRDISWGNVLIRSKKEPSRAATLEQPSDVVKGVKSGFGYRFVSNIFDEDE